MALLRFAASHDFRVNAESRVVEKNAIVHRANIDALDHSIAQKDDGLRQVSGNADVFGEMIQRTDRKHPKHRVRSHDCGGDGIDGPVTTAGHHHRWRLFHCLLNQLVHGHVRISPSDYGVWQRRCQLLQQLRTITLTVHRSRLAVDQHTYDLAHEFPCRVDPVVTITAVTVNSGYADRYR